MNMREKFIMALNARGLKEVKRTGKYVVFASSTSGGNYYVGQSGGLRFGASVATSHPVSNKLKMQMLQNPTGLDTSVLDGI